MKRSLLIVLLCHLLAGCSRGGGATSNHAADFTLESAAAPIKTVHLADFKGKLLLVDFWATWCSPCRQVMPQIEKVYQKYKGQGLEVIGVTDEPRATVRAFQPTSGVTYPLYLDLGHAMNAAYGIDAIPHLFLIDRTGRIVYDEIGAGDNLDALDAAIRGNL